MPKYRRQELAAEAARRNREQTARLGGRVRDARLRRRATQLQLGERVGLSRSAVSAIERGLGGGHTLDTWQRLAVALDIRLNATRSSDPARSTDVGLRDDRRRRLTFVECWNTIGDLGAAARSSARKLAEAEAFAIASGGEHPHRVAGCWVVRATARNRDLVRRYPAVFAARFPGSSLAWVRALTHGTDPPAEPGLIWCDVRTTRLFAWRR